MCTPYKRKANLLVVKKSFLASSCTRTHTHTHVHACTHQKHSSSQAPFSHAWSPNTPSLHSLRGSHHTPSHTKQQEHNTPNKTAKTHIHEGETTLSSFVSGLFTALFSSFSFLAFAVTFTIGLPWLRLPSAGRCFFRAPFVLRHLYLHHVHIALIFGRGRWG